MPAWVTLIDFAHLHFGKTKIALYDLNTFFLETIPNLSIWCPLQSRSINMGQNLCIFSLYTSLLPRRRPKSKVSRHPESLFMRKSCDALNALGSWAPNGIQLNGQTRNALHLEFIRTSTLGWICETVILFFLFKENNKISLLKTVDGKWAISNSRRSGVIWWRSNTVFLSLPDFTCWQS